MERRARTRFPSASCRAFAAARKIRSYGFLANIRGSIYIFLVRSMIDRSFLKAFAERGFADPVAARENRGFQDSLGDELPDVLGAAAEEVCCFRYREKSRQIGEVSGLHFEPLYICSSVIPVMAEILMAVSIPNLFFPLN